MAKTKPHQVNHELATRPAAHLTKPFTAADVTRAHADDLVRARKAGGKCGPWADDSRLRPVSVEGSSGRWCLVPRLEPRRQRFLLSGNPWSEGGADEACGDLLPRGVQADQDGS